MTITHDETQRWSRDGFFVLHNVLSQEEVSFLRQAIDEHRLHIAPSRQILYTHQLPSEARGVATGTESNPKETEMGSLMEQWLNPHLRELSLSTLAIATRLRDRMQSFLQAEPVLFQDLLMSKNPGHRPFPFHQDFPFWPVAEPAGGVLWTTLDVVNEAAGGLSLARGSHLAGLGPPIDLHSGLPQPGCAPLTINLLPYETVTPELRPGDAIWFHPLIWHRSGVNISGMQRRVWASTWLPAQARWSRQHAPRHPFASRVDDGAAVGERGWTPLRRTAEEFR